jgi:serine/threonine protein kinase
MAELPLVGDDFAGYRLRAVLGRGGMSVVYQAENPRLGSVIALKVLAPELATDDAFRARFLEESRIAVLLNHPNVIPVYDMGSHQDLLYIAMRYVSGTDLRQVIKKRGRVIPATAIFLLGQAARALDAAHRRGLVHRDVKPGNLLIERGGDDGDRLNVFVDNAARFHLQEDATKPMIFVSAGTGFAPMRALLWERLAMKRAGVPLAEAALP